MLLRLVVLVGILSCNVAVARPPAANSLSATQSAAVSTAVREAMQKDQVVGMAIGIIENDRIVYTQGFGYADREQQVPVTTATLFRWASVSKPVTAIAAMQLVERGKLDLDADIRKYVPEFPPHGVTITTRELLGHQGGIVHYDNGPVIRTEKKYPTPHPFEDVINALDFFKESPLVNAPGEKFSYSTYGFVLVSAIVQRAGGEPFARQVRERIIQPLGLQTMQPDYQWLNLPHRAVGYRKDGDKIVRSADTDVSWKLGGGGYISDIGDFAGFAKGLIDRRLLSAKSEQLMWTPQALRNGEPTHYGFGFEIDTHKDGRLRVAHNGSQEKSRTRLVIYPHEQRGVVVMTNSEWVDPGKFSTLIFAALGATEPRAARKD